MSHRARASSSPQRKQQQQAQQCRCCNADPAVVDLMDR
jgi:hypothetical protein